MPVSPAGSGLVSGARGWGRRRLQTAVCTCVSVCVCMSPRVLELICIVDGSVCVHVCMYIFTKVYAYPCLYCVCLKTRLLKKQTKKQPSPPKKNQATLTVGKTGLEPSMLVKQLFLHDPPSFVETNPRLIGSQTGIENLFPIKQEVHSGRSLRNVNFCLNVPKLCKHEAFGAQAYFAAPWKKDLSLTTGGVLFGVFLD